MRTRITNEELEKIRLSFLGCGNCEVASFNGKCDPHVGKKKTRNCPNGRQDLRTDFVLYVTLCHLMETYCGVFYFILIFFLPLGDWTFIVNGRKRSYVLHAKLQEEATRWANAIQEVNLKKKMVSTMNSRSSRAERIVVVPPI